MPRLPINEYDIETFDAMDCMDANGLVHRVFLRRSDSPWVDTWCDTQINRTACLANAHLVTCLACIYYRSANKYA